MRIIKNVSRTNVKTIFRGRKIELPAKHSLSLDWEREEDRALYYYLTKVYDFVIDITSRILEEKGVNKDEK